MSPSSRKTAISAPPARTISRLTPPRAPGGTADCAAVDTVLLPRRDPGVLRPVADREQGSGRRVHRARLRRSRLGYRMLGKNETRVAVFLGGRSPEHDVSVITGLQALKAIDQERFVPFPVYVTPRGEWLVGESLSERRNYLPDSRTRGELTEVTLSLGEPGRGVLVPRRSGLFSRRPPVEVDVAMLAFHGLGGEDGQFQGLLETANLPYTGMRTLAAAVWMGQAATKRRVRGLDIPLLHYAVASRTAGGLPSGEALRRLLDGIGLPCIA